MNQQGTVEQSSADALSDDDLALAVGGSSDPMKDLKGDGPGSGQVDQATPIQIESHHASPGHAATGSQPGPSPPTRPCAWRHTINERSEIFANQRRNHQTETMEEQAHE